MLDGEEWTIGAFTFPIIIEVAAYYLIWQTTQVCAQQVRVPYR